MSVEAVERYYNECHVDYRVVWRSHRNLCIHFGYFDAEHTDHRSAVENMNRQMLRRTKIGPTDRTLDAGCGVGGSSFFIASRTGARVTGINIQPLHLEVARAECRARGLAHLVDFEKRNYCGTGFDAESFDVVWALESVCHSDDKKAFLAEAYRVLRPGGRIVVGDFVQFLTGLDAHAAREMQIWLDGWAIPHLAGYGEFRDWMSEIGFDGVTSENITPHVMRSSRRLYKASLIALPFSGFATAMGWRSERQTANVRASYYQYRTIRAGLWGYAIYSGVKPDRAR
ncbi:MAG: methyltransferase domain-containing protein [Bryobacteraceae bacterium]|nr:methyltransferase domain-containing protein [Bryobacteraceae bacterium]